MKAVYGESRTYGLAGGSLFNIGIRRFSMEPVRLDKPFEKYVVYPDGRVWSDKSMRFLSTHMVNSGYLVVRLYNENKTFHCLVHRLVASVFVPNPYCYNVVNHIDGNRLNNMYTNLEWCTQQQNLFHAQLQNKMHDRITFPYIVKDTLTDMTFSCRTLKRCFDKIGMPTCYCYHSSCMKQFWKTHLNTEPYKFRQYLIFRDVNHPLTDMDIE